MLNDFLTKTIEFDIITTLSIKDILERIGNLLTDESIKFKTDVNSIYSIKIPLPILSLDMRQYTRRNWVGINPFIFISKIKLLTNKIDGDKVNINLKINRNRAVIIYLVILLLLAFVAINLPNVWIGVLFLSFFACLSFGFIFSLCINKFIKKEIVDAVVRIGSG